MTSTTASQLLLTSGSPLVGATSYMRVARTVQPTDYHPELAHLQSTRDLIDLGTTLIVLGLAGASYLKDHTPFYFRRTLDEP